eukprot:6175812-Pleurochrysis_carterae.AAC.1
MASRPRSSLQSLSTMQRTGPSDYRPTSGQRILAVRYESSLFVVEIDQSLALTHLSTHTIGVSRGSKLSLSADMRSSDGKPETSRTKCKTTCENEKLA